LKTATLATLLCGCAALLGCGARQRVATVASAAPGAPTVAPDANWQLVATDEDRDRIRGWRDTWLAAVAKARKGGRGADIDRLGELADPDRALTDPLPPAGAYRCTVYKIGAAGTAVADFTAFEPTDCEIAPAGALTEFHKTGGVQRPDGLLYGDGPRAIFLGTMVYGDEIKPFRYGQDRLRDMAGYIERIGDKRWRLVLPAPRFESMLDIIEIVPA
jgi:hypothetical protein